MKGGGEGEGVKFQPRMTYEPTRYPNQSRAKNHLHIFV